MTSGSTKLHPDTPRPNRDDVGPSGSTADAPPFSGVLRVGADDPVFGSPPTLAQSFQGDSDGLDADLVGTQALLQTYLGGQLQGPQAGGVTEVTRTLVEQLTQGCRSGFIENGSEGFGTAGISGKAGQANVMKGANHIAYGLARSTYHHGDLPWGLSLVGGQKDLAATHHEAVDGAQTLLKFLMLFLAQDSNKDW